ncbi:ABC transporter substrate-binding protein [Acinetobacter baumannii]|uniref:Receptor ligand binding region family protein n=1 Tax=Acinetobacter baumannii 99063 TaxID=1310630 RepID=A0A009SMT8_ACIBA|nr:MULTISPECIES: ABC transporter substrate-binding protein [Acinetobacter]EXC42879.1 receptor ligand binding region family protein [Acinetobacter baumannii 99063]EXC43322.1 receptor ligand binding region family protein [Acinetobacter baumannii 99063]EXC45825.1 receptor ligand binding region family protein [Acinetobacter baumannii 99063]MCG6641404.1 ABC transporter substrate-binding protein [Acinetobacter baumannii]MCT9505526.1 ABC transporter substrate-binding protein [Acinetobacter baumannii]
MKFTQLAVLSSIIAAGVSSAYADIKVGVVTSSSGPVAMVGIPQKNTIALLPKTLGGEKVQYISIDDASDPTASVKAINKLIKENNVDAIIGPSGSPNAMAVIGTIAKAGVPLLAPVGTSAAVLPMNEQKKWVFKTTQNDDVIAQALVEDMVKRKIKTLGFIGTADPYGDNWGKVIASLAAKNGIKVVAKESFQRQDTSLTGQALKLIATKPQAILVAAPGSSAVPPQTALYDRGYRGQMYQTHGAALDQFLKMGGNKVNNTILAASLMLVINEIPNSNVSKPIALKYMNSYKKMYGEYPATFGANVYDAGLLLEKAVPVALKKAKPGTAQFRQELRTALEHTKELAGTQGVYNMTPSDHSGFDKRGRVMITVKNGKWTLLK